MKILERKNLIKDKHEHTTSEKVHFRKEDYEKDKSGKGKHKKDNSAQWK